MFFDKKTLKSTCIIMYIYTTFKFLYPIEYYNWIDNIRYKKNYSSNIAKKNSTQTFGMFIILRKRKSDILSSTYI